MKASQNIIQSCLIIISTFIIIEFYRHDTLPFLTTLVVTVVLIAVNCSYAHWCVLRNRTESRKRFEDLVSELRERDFNKNLDR